MQETAIMSKSFESNDGLMIKIEYFISDTILATTKKNNKQIALRLIIFQILHIL